jgi:hypothetical protein
VTLLWGWRDLILAGCIIWTYMQAYSFVYQPFGGGLIRFWRNKLLRRGFLTWKQRANELDGALF